jgi:hypothetical protein
VTVPVGVPPLAGATVALSVTEPPGLALVGFEYGAVTVTTDVTVAAVLIVISRLAEALEAYASSPL